MELEDPNPDLHELFLLYNQLYFDQRLASVEVRWSKRMMLCAGMCYYFRGGYCSIRLSEPLLKFRPRQDMINTLLHEMIHAYLFVTGGNQDRDGHGPDFQKHMHRINQLANSQITIYHSFHQEVDYYRVHVWKCNGPCQHRPPFFGIVKRSMNRPPQPADRWWKEHQMTCGGLFTKISEPEKKEKKQGNLDQFVEKNNSLKGKEPDLNQNVIVIDDDLTLGQAPEGIPPRHLAFNCPACTKVFQDLISLNTHLDNCLTFYF